LTRFFGNSRRGKFQVWDEILDELHLGGDERVLDMGCGRGAVLIAVARRLTTGRVTGIDLWSTWAEIRCPTLVLRGAESDVLSRDTLRQMQARRPGVEALELPGIGHAPALMSYDQIAAVRAFSTWCSPASGQVICRSRIRKRLPRALSSRSVIAQSRERV